MGLIQLGSTPWVTTRVQISTSLGRFNMSSPNRPINNYKHYHAHVYFDAETIEFARHLCIRASENFSLKMGRVHEQPVGPHTVWSCQLMFSYKEFDALIPWLEENRDTLTVFVHPLTGDDLADHTELATWLGDAVPLDVSIFKVK